MSWIADGTRIAFKEDGPHITSGKEYTVRNNSNGEPFFYADHSHKKTIRVISAEHLEMFGGRIVHRPVQADAEPSKDTRAELIKALKERLEDVKDSLSSWQVRKEKVWIANILQSSYGIKAEVVPGPATVTFTELAHNS